MPKVSILLPVYNQEQWFGESICSVLKQTEPDFELIIIDDGSTDKSLEIAHTYAAIDDRIKVIHSDQRCGQAIATNTAARAATGEYMAWHHADDNYVPDFLEKTLAAKADVVFGAYQFISVDGQLGRIIESGDWSRERLKKACYLCCGTMLYKRSLFESLGGYDEDLVIEVDWDFSLRATKDTRVVVLPDVLFYYRDHHLSSNRARLTGSVRKHDTETMRKRIEGGYYG